MLNKMHGLAGWLLVAGFAATSGAANTSLGQERETAGKGRPRNGAAPACLEQHISGTLKSVDAAAGTITLTSTVAQGRDGGERREPVTQDKTYALAKNVEIAVGAGSVTRSGRCGQRPRARELTSQYSRKPS